MGAGLSRPLVAGTPAGVRLRPASRQDASKIRSLIIRVQINPMSLDWQHFVVAVDDGGELVGCGQVKHHGDGSRELASIAVEEPWRRRGVASSLVADLQQRHGSPLWLTCQSALVGFYQPFGFREVHDPRLLPRYFRKILRLARMFRWLGPGERLAVMLWEG
jgi:N-acetylglutamate synthase-like GNAT family acetyltransferase